MTVESMRLEKVERVREENESRGDREREKESRANRERKKVEQIERERK